MDLREIQALHARYADSPAVIDLPAQYARIPVRMLAGPATPKKTGSFTMRQWAQWSGAVILAIGAAGVVGTQAGHIWEHFHHAHAAKPLVITPHPAPALLAASPAPHPAADDPLSPKPLTAEDFGGNAGPTLASQAVATAVSHIDAVQVDALHVTPKATVSADDEAAIHSPMIEQHPALSPVAVRAAEQSVTVQPVVAPAVTTKADADAMASEAMKAPKRKWHPHAESAPHSDDAPKITTPATKAASSHAGGDVTLF